MLMAAGAALAAFTVPGDARQPLLWGGAVATTALAWMSRVTWRQRRTVQDLRRQLDRQLSAAERIAGETLPAVVAGLQEGRPADAPLPDDTRAPAVDPRLATAHRSLMRTVVNALQAKEYQRGSAQRAMVNVASRIQAEMHRLQADLRAMQFSHGRDPDVMGDLMHLEHGVHVAGRVATSLAVLGGGTPGRQWRKTMSLYDVLRLGSAPITEYRRVKRHRVAEIGVVGPAVEPLSVLLAELLDNATRYSPPNTTVIMNTEEVAAGVEISIEDKGTGLTEESRKRAEFLLTQGVDGMDLDELGESARMGLRVAGILAHQHRFRISLRPSACDGVRAIVFVPREWLTSLPVPPTLPDTASAASRPSSEAVLRREADGLADHGQLASGLPRRRRRPTLSAQEAAAVQAASDGQAHPTEQAPQPGLWMADFFDRTAHQEKPSTDSERPTDREP